MYPASSWQTADRKNSQCFNRIVHRRLWVKVHKIFHTCRAPRGLFTVKVRRGVTAENFERIAKNLEFLHLYMQKRALCLPRGSKFKVEHTPCMAIVLRFHSRFKRSEIRFRSGVISSELYAPIAIFRDFSVFSPKTIIRGLALIWVRR